MGALGWPFFHWYWFQERDRSLVVSLGSYLLRSDSHFDKCEDQEDRHHPKETH